MSRQRGVIDVDVHSGLEVTGPAAVNTREGHEVIGNGYTATSNYTQRTIGRGIKRICLMVGHETGRTDYIHSHR